VSAKERRYESHCAVISLAFSMSSGTELAVLGVLSPIADKSDFWSAEICGIGSVGGRFARRRAGRRAGCMHFLHRSL